MEISFRLVRNLKVRNLKPLSFGWIKFKGSSIDVDLGVRVGFEVSRGLFVGDSDLGISD